MKQEEDRRKLEEEIKRKEMEKAKELARAAMEIERNKRIASAKSTSNTSTKSVYNSGNYSVLYIGLYIPQYRKLISPLLLEIKSAVEIKNTIFLIFY